MSRVYGYCVSCICVCKCMYIHIHTHFAMMPITVIAIAELQNQNHCEKFDSFMALGYKMGEHELWPDLCVRRKNKRLKETD